ncbi:hypothetical protein [Labrenzia sp. PHM005]|uniref:hypothetical protein n=1 Tax=Labrenzia sp. PHM005 TaxID=2590016 RepID=UPI0011400533|nr:hypothetical protein [Labrenzia sp. PHM005]QDG77693.1 hypothetical protein FJ695_18505 [Labrenzia sp. PHM005]
MLKNRKRNLELRRTQDEGLMMRTHFMVRLHSRLTDLLMEVSPGLTVEEMMIRQAILLGEEAGTETDLEYITETVGVSATSANRKLSKLIAMDYVVRERNGRKFIYKTPPDISSGIYFRDDGRSVLDDGVEEILRQIDKLVLR